ncbi:MAG TPA: hypothetical protein VGS41_14345 [Chthonomonadales bacterium]|nr:hypothetical protein [Chthonomonadales bacterium]
MDERGLNGAADAPGPLRIAMWSGPRNISSAMMRSWGNRLDAWVTDEPLYAHYLLVTGFNHPGREEVIASQETDWRKVASWLTGPVPNGKRVWYQKHMAHHLLPDIDRKWIHGLTNCFLIREPREMITSLIKVYPEAGLADTGLPQQMELFTSEMERTGEVPPVIDSKDMLLNPEGMSRLLCRRLGVEFSDRMLSWPVGTRETDGAWAPYWYGAVERSTGYEKYRSKPDPVPQPLQGVLDECDRLYCRLAAHRLVL